VLYVHNNFLVSFHHLGSQPNLEVLYAANNCIASFYGMPSLPKLQVVNLEGNPIIKHPRYRIMCLIAAGPHIKKIDNETVSYKEREFSKLQIATNPLVVDAIRAGWLMDLEPKSSNDFKRIIKDLEMVDWDDRESVRSSGVYQQLLGTPTLIPELLEKFEPKKVMKPVESPSQPAVQNQYAHELKMLQNEIARKNEELKRTKEELKATQEQHLSGDDLNMCSQINIDGFSIHIEKQLENVTLRIKTGTLQVLSANNTMIKQVSFNRIVRVCVFFFNIYKD
jgi:hypothetical protein